MLKSRVACSSKLSSRICRFAILSMLTSICCVYGQSSQMTCAATSSVPPLARLEGLSEIVGDVLLTCAGGVLTPAGQPVPQFNLTILLNTSVTSKLLANSLTETLLIADEPLSATRPGRSLLNCGTMGAPDSGPSGAGTCSILSTGNPDLTYDGTINGWGVATCDSSSGRPAPNSYGCGRPNVFQGKLGTPLDPNQQNAITFFSIPIDAPGSGARMFRIVNLRASVNSVGPDPDLSSISMITAGFSFNGPTALPIQNALQQVAYVQPGLSTTSCGSPTPGSRVRFCEQFAAAFKPKNISAYTGDHFGIASNATLFQGQPYPTYNGGKNYTNDVAQNVVGAVYNTESGFEWQDNLSYGPPSPNPPDGVGTIKIDALENPLQSNIGVADAGTRIAFQFHSIPPGASVVVPDIIYLFGLGHSYNGDPTQMQSTSSGVMVRTSTDTSGAGPFSPTTGPLTSASSLVVYEVLWADPFSNEFSELPYTVLNAPPQTNLTADVSFAPFYPSGAAASSSLTLPVARFASGSCFSPGCVTVGPNTGYNSMNTGPVNLTSDPTAGLNLNGAQVVLRAAGFPDIPGTMVSSQSHTLTATFATLGAPEGTRDVVVTPQSGSPVTLPRGFSIFDVPACSFGVGPSVITVSAFGEFESDRSVSISDTTCTWDAASTSASWITLPPPTMPFAGYWIQQYIVAPNPGNVERTANIVIAGTILSVVQGTSSEACGFSVTPNHGTISAAGGLTPFDVGTYGNCMWTVDNNNSWLHLVSSTPNSNGTGGTTTFSVDPNPGPARTGEFFLGGVSANINQQAGTRVGVFRSGFFWLEDVDGDRQWDPQPDRAFAFGGVPGDIPISGDWDGSGTSKVGVYRPSNGLFILDYDGDGRFTNSDKAYNLGVGTQAGDVPVVGDWNGDGKTKVGLFRQGFFWILDTNGDGVFQQGVDQTFAFGGVAGDLPIVGDWNGDGKSKLGLFRQGFFWILDYNGNGSLDNVNMPGGDKAFAFGGISGDVPVVGDWNGSGTSKVGVFRSGFFWVLDANGNNQFDGTGGGQDSAFPFGGISRDKPVIGKW